MEFYIKTAKIVLHKGKIYDKLQYVLGLQGENSGKMVEISPLKRLMGCHMFILRQAVPTPKKRNIVYI